MSFPRYIVCYLVCAAVSCADVPDIGHTTNALSNLVVPASSVEAHPPVGVVPGQWSVSGGGASYTIPLAVPPGRSGMAPAVSISYSDSRGNGLLGVGFGVSASSAIAPCRDTVADDGAPDRPEFDGNDVYCLDGRRLFETGTWSGGAEYRFRPDNFTRIRADGVAPESSSSVPARFVVDAGNGQTAIYESRIIAPRMRYADAHGEAPQHLEDVVWRWLLTTRVDAHGNRIDYVYEEDTPATNRADLQPDLRYAVEYRLKRIDFTGNLAAGLSPRRHVQFEYESRPDAIDGYVSGVHSRQSQRLKRVVMEAPNPQVTERVWDYTLEYLTTGSGRSRLDSITHCNQFDGCLPPTTFEWEEPTISYQRIETGVFNGSDVQQDIELQIGDFNGDGFDDLMYWDASLKECVGGAGGNFYWYGTTEDCSDYVDTARVLGGWRLAHSDGTTLHAEPFYTPMTAHFASRVEWNHLQGRFVAADGTLISWTDESNPPNLLDLDRDGKTDWIQARSGHIYFSGGGYPESIGSTYVSAPPDVEPDVRYFGDFDGDGLTDVITHQNRGVPFDEFDWIVRFGLADVDTTRAGSQPGFDAPIPFVFNPAELWSGIDEHDWRPVLQVADTNGDGTDELLHPFLSEDSTIHAADWNGTTFVDRALNIATMVQTDPTGAQLHRDQRTSPLLADLNSDGLVDYIATQHPADDGTGAGSDRLLARLNTGEGFGPWFVVSEDFIIPDDEAGRAPSRYTLVEFHERTALTFDDTVRAMDANADGVVDFVVREQDNGGETYLFLSSPSGFTRMLAPFEIGEPTMVCRSPSSCEDEEPLKLGWTHRVMDIDGNGLPDIIYYDDDVGFVVYRHEGLTNRERIVATVNGHQRRDEVRYEHMHDPVVYDPQIVDASVDCEYPVACVPRRGTVAHELVLDAGSAQERILEYRYYAGRTDVRGQGSLGFAHQVVIDQGNGHTTTTHADQRRVSGRYPYLGHSDVETSITFDGRTAATLHQPKVTVVDGPGQTYHLELDRVYNERSEGAGLTWDDTVFLNHDSFGRPETQITTSGGDRVDGTSLGLESVEISYIYEDRLAEWRLGLVTERAVTSTVAGDAELRTVTMQYDGRGELEKVFTAPGTVLQLETRLIRDTDTGNVIRIESENNPADPGSVHRLLTQTIVYDDLEEIFASQHENTLGHVTRRAVHPAFGVTVAAEDDNGIAVSAVLDGFGQVVRVQDATQTLVVARDHVLDLSSNPVGVRTRAQSSTGAESFRHSNHRGQVTREGALADNGNWYTSYALFDSRGRLERTSHPIQTDAFGVEATGGAAVLWAQTSSYDALDRLIETEHADGSRTTRTYDIGEVSEADYADDTPGANPLRIRRLFSDTGGRPLESLQEDGDPSSSASVSTSYSYGAFGELTQVVDAAGAVETRTYDVYGRAHTQHSTDGGQTEHLHDAFGFAVSTTFPDGAVTYYTHDDLGRVVREKSNDGDTFFFYDAPVDRTWPSMVGALHHAISPDGTISRFRYDSLGRTTREEVEVDGEGFEIDYKFQSNGQLLRQTFPSIGGTRDSVTYSYAYGSLAQLTDDVTGSLLWHTSDRDGAGRLTKFEYGNGVQSLRTYDPATGLLQEEDVSGGIHEMTYGYAPGGYVSSHTDHLENVTEVFEFDYLERLTDWDQLIPGKDLHTEYIYDPTTQNLAGRIRRRGGSIEELVSIAYQPGHHRPDNRGLGTMTYDARGRRTASPGDFTSIDYTEFDLPRTIIRGGKTTDFRYDAFQQRVRRDALETLVTTHDGRYRRTGTKSHRLTIMAPTGPVAEVRIEEAAGTRELVYLHQNYRGDTVATSDESGNLIERIAYSPFGRRLGAGWAPDSNPPMSTTHLGFTGHEHDYDLGLINMRGRMFDPETSTFLTQDPLVPRPLSGLSWNGYSYVTYSPTQFVDPSGFNGNPLYAERENGADRRAALQAHRLAAGVAKDDYVAEARIDPDGDCIAGTTCTAPGTTGGAFIVATHCIRGARAHAA